MLEEHINQSYGDISETCIAGLTPGARDMVCRMIERYNADNDDEDDDVEDNP